jgi:hypothetical protein
VRLIAQTPGQIDASIAGLAVQVGGETPELRTRGVGLVLSLVQSGAIDAKADSLTVRFRTCAGGLGFYRSRLTT